MQQGIFDLLLAGEEREDGDFLRKEGGRACDNLFNLQRALSWNLRCSSSVDE